MLKKKLEEMTAELKSLQEKINEGDDEAIKSGSELMESINELKEKIKAAEEANELLKSVGTETTEEEEEVEGIKAMNMEHLKSNPGVASTYIKAVGPIAGPEIGVTDQRVVDAVPTLGVRELFGSETINGNALNYFVLSKGDGTPGITAEGAAKPQFDVKYNKVTAALVKQAGFMKETDELLSDAAFLESAIRNRGVY